MKKEFDHRLGMKEYDMKEYWSKRAKYFDEDEFKAVCVFNASRQVNEFFDTLQKSLFSKLLGKIGNLENKKVLEIGCGIGRWAKYLMEKEPTIQYTGIDVSPKMVDIAKKRVPSANFLNISGDNLIFQDESFDLVFSITVLHHIPYEKQLKAIREICRVTKRGGHIVIIEDIKQPRNSFNMFAHPINEWRNLFERNGCQTLYLLKHKCRIPIPIINKMFVRMRIALEKVAAHILPEKYFYGVGMVFQKIR